MPPADLPVLERQVGPRASPDHQERPVEAEGLGLHLVLRAHADPDRLGRAAGFEEQLRWGIVHVDGPGCRPDDGRCVCIYRSILLCAVIGRQSKRGAGRAD